jgi:hypothetical protein
MNKVKDFEKKIKIQGKRSEGEGHGIKWKVSSERIHMWGMNALAPTNKTLWPRCVTITWVLVFNLYV